MGVDGDGKMAAVRRSQAVILIVALMVAPLALGFGAACCQRQDDCSKTFCPMAGHGQRSGQKQKSMDCDHAAGSQNDCKMTSNCQHTLDASLLAPLRLAVQARHAQLLAPAANGFLLVADVVTQAEGFFSPPLQPPRS